MGLATFFGQNHGLSGFRASGSYFSGLPVANFSLVCGVVCLFVGWQFGEFGGGAKSFVWLARFRVGWRFRLSFALRVCQKVYKAVSRQ